MGTWGVIPAIAFPFQGGAKQGSEVSQMQQMKKVGEPDWQDKQDEKDLNESMLPAQGEWYNKSLSYVDKMKSALLQERTQWFATHKGKPVPPELSKKWNEDIARVEDVRIKVKSQEGRLKQNFKDVTETLKADISSPMSSAQRIMTDNFGVPIIGQKTNGMIGMQNLAEVLLSNDQRPGGIGGGSVVAAYIPETQFTGAFQNKIYDSFSKVVKSSHVTGQSQFMGGTPTDQYLYTITNSSNADEVWSAAGNIMNTLTSKEWTDLRSDFWENIVKSGGLRQDGSFVFDTYGVTDDGEGGKTLARGQYVLASDKDKDKIGVITKILNGGKPQNDRELKVVQDMISEYGMHRIMNLVPTQIETKFTQDKIQIKGAEQPVGTFFSALTGGATSTTTTLSKEYNSTIDNVMDPVKRFEMAWEGYERNLRNSPTFKSLRKVNGESDRDFILRQEEYINNSKDLMAKEFLGEKSKEILQERNAMITVRKYDVSPQAFLKSGYAMHPLNNENFWWVGSKETEKVTPDMFKRTPFVINVSSILNGPGLFTNDKNSTIAVADALIYEDDLKNFKYTMMEGGKPVQITYEDLLDDYPDIASKILRRADEDPLYVKNKIESVAKASDKGSMYEDYKNDADEYYIAKVYIVNDGMLESAVREEQKDLKLKVNTYNPAEAAIN